MTYGRYIADDGLPRWSLPPCRKQYALWSEIMTAAVTECYADYGASWLRSRMDNAPSMGCIRRHANSRGIHINAHGRKEAWKICAEKHRKLWIQNKIAVLSGLPMTNGMHVAAPRKTIAMRYNLVKRWGYEYGEAPWMLYDANTRRRADEEKLAAKYGIKFGDAEEAI